MLDPQTAHRIREIQIKARKSVTDVLAGEYHSVFKGRGMAFDEVREYQPGDDVRAIDWNVTARTGQPHIKRYVEERELTILFMVDLSASGHFGSRQRLKNDLAAEIAGLLSFSAIANNDKVGLLCFSDRIEHFSPPRKGSSHALRLIRDILHFKARGSGTDLGLALDHVGKIMPRRCVIFLLSDFRDQGYEKPLRVAARRHDLVAISIHDPLELALPKVGLLRLRDSESGEFFFLDSSRGRVRREFKERARQGQLSLATLLQRMGIDHIPLATADDYLPRLLRFFKVREGRR
ncbi:MAG: DUF58 domain-containing protein [Thermodesulfobacteriota bacterium]